MANINTTNNNKNAVEIRAELNKNGTTIEYIIVNGTKVGMLGTTGAKDREKALKAIQTAFDASDGNIYAMMSKLNTIATIEEKEIKADEMVRVNGIDVIISYEAKTAYATNGEEIANCTELPDMPNEAIKAVLMARVEAELAKHCCDCCCDDDDDDDMY